MVASPRRRAGEERSIAVRARERCESIMEITRGWQEGGLDITTAFRWLELEETKRRKMMMNN